MHANTIPKISPTDNAFFLLEEEDLMGDVGLDEGGDIWFVFYSFYGSISLFSVKYIAEKKLNND